MTNENTEVTISSGSEGRDGEGVERRGDPCPNDSRTNRGGSGGDSRIDARLSLSQSQSSLHSPSSGINAVNDGRGQGVVARTGGDATSTENTKNDDDKTDQAWDTGTRSTSGEGDDLLHEEEYVRSHVHVLQFVMDTEIVSRILEDKEALRTVSLQMRNAHESSMHRYLDDDTCQRVGRLIRMLTAYFEQVRQDACASRFSGQIIREGDTGEPSTDSTSQLVRKIVESYHLGTLEERMHLFEGEVVHYCLCSVLPSVFGMMLQHVGSLPTGSMAGLVVMWARLCGEMISARMVQMASSGRYFALQYEIPGDSDEGTGRPCGTSGDGDEGNDGGSRGSMDDGGSHSDADHGDHGDHGDRGDRGDRGDHGDHGDRGDDDEAQTPGGRAYASHTSYVEQTKSVFDVMADAVKLVDTMLHPGGDGNRQPDIQDLSDELKLIVFELERLEPERLTDWVDLDARKMPTDCERWGRFHAAIVVDVFGKMESVWEALLVSESLAVDVALLKFLSVAMPVLSATKRLSVVEGALGAVCEKYSAAFDGEGCSDREAQDDAGSNSGFGGFADLVAGTSHDKGISGHAVAALLLPALGTMFDIIATEQAVAGPSAVSTAVSKSIASLEERMIWRLFSSNNVSEQLLAVTSLIEILEAVGEMDTSPGPDGHDEELQSIRVSWIRSSDIVSEMLKVNLHHAQYVEDMLLLLGALAVHGLVDSKHLAQLWSTVQDEGTFEEIKSNICQILGFLSTTTTTADDMELFCQNLQANCDARTVEGKYIEDIMLAAARHDSLLHMMVRLVDISLGFCLDGSSRGDPLPNRTKRMLSGDLLLDITRRYLAHCRAPQGNGPVIDCICSVIGTCMGRITTGNNDESGQPVQEPHATELLQPLRLLLRIFSGSKIPTDALDDIYKVVNDGAKLMSDVMAGYEHNLYRMSRSDHAPELLRLFNAILRSVLSESNYYVEFGKVKKILGWAISPDASLESTSYAWSLLTYLVQDEKGVTAKTARLFLTSFMELVDHLNDDAWLCFTAYLAASLDFESSLAVDESYVDLIVMTDHNHHLDIWGPLKDYLCASLLQRCGTNIIAAQCSKLLSHVLITGMDLNCSVANLQQVKESIESFKDMLLENPERVLMLLSDVLEAYDYRECDDHGLLGSVPVDAEGYGTRGPAMDVDVNRQAAGPRSSRPLYSCYRDSDISFKVVLQNLPMSPRPSASGGLQGVDVRCPRNCMIADLRAIVSLQASHLVGYMIPHANFNLRCGGKYLGTNLSRVFECVAEGDEVVAVFNTKANFRASPLPDFHLSHILAQDDVFFESLMTLGDQGSRQALELIDRLPISERMVGMISNSSTGDIFKSPEDLGISYMLYMCRLMQSYISPMAVDGLASCSVGLPQMQVPASWLLHVMSRLYNQVGTYLGGDLVRTIVHLVRWSISEELHHDNVDNAAEGSGSRGMRGADRAMVLKLLHDVLGDALSSPTSSSGLLLDDVRFVAAGALTAILDLGQGGSFKDEELSLLIADIKASLCHSDRKVRNVGLHAVHALCARQDNLDPVLLRDLISGILLCEPQSRSNPASSLHLGGTGSTADEAVDPPKEQLQLCSWFVARMDSSLNGDMLTIAETVCQRILQRLRNRKSIDGYSKCLQIALLRVNAADLSSMKSLSTEILDTFLFSCDTPAGAQASSDVPISPYFRSFQTRKYALDHQDALYRVLLSSALLSEDCWQITHGRLQRFFNGASFPGLYNNSALECFRNLDSYCGLLNGGATCYMNATFQQLYMMPRLRRLLLTAPIEENVEKSSPVFEALRTIFLRLFAGVDEVVDPSCFWKEFKDYDGNPVDVREHQDGYEFFTRLQDAVDEYLNSLGHEKIMRSVLGGSFNQIIEVPDHKEVKSEREEEFYQISVDVRGKKDLIESLESYVAPETLDGQNQWFCESLGHKVDAKKRTLIKRLPESLVFHLKRFEWDYETYQRLKIKDRFEFPLELDMGPYLDASCQGDVGAESESPRGNVSEPHIYDLSGIVVHSGTAFAGHYYSFAKERTSGRWFHFDDDSVTSWDVGDIEQECFGGQFQPSRESKMYMRSQSAYMVMYDRRSSPADEKTAVIESVPDATQSGVAWSEEFDDTCSCIPAVRLQTLLRTNHAEVTKSTAFSQSLAQFMSTISKEVESAIRGPHAQKPKVATAETSDIPTKIPLHNEVFYVPRTQGLGADRELPLAVNQAAALGLEYICRIAVCGPLGRDPAIDVLEPLISVFQEPSVAKFILSQSSLIEGVLAAMASPYKASRSMLRNVMATCIKATVDSKECIQLLEKVLDHIRVALETPALFITWRDLLGLLCDVAQSSTCTSMLANYTDVLLSFSDTMLELWRQQTKVERATDATVLTSYAVLVCNLLRHHRLSNSGEDVRDVQIGNPFCIARDRELSITLSTEAIKCLIGIGMDDDALLLFLQFFSWESSSRSAMCVEALIDNMRTTQHQSQVPLTVSWLRMEDSRSTDRRRAFLCSAVGLFNEFEGNGWLAYNVSLSIASVLSSSPFLVSSTSSSSAEDIDLEQWARKLADTCMAISRRIGNDLQYRDQWIQGIPSSADEELRALYDPVQLLETIKNLFDADVADVMDLQRDTHDEIDLVKASSDDEDKENDGDEVKEIELD